MAVRPSVRQWLLDAGEPSIKLRLLRELDGRPATDSEVQATRRELDRVGWAAAILKEQHPAGQWDTAGTSARDLYWPKYVTANWRLIVLADLGVRGTHPRVRRAVDLFLRRYGGSRGQLGGSGGSEVCFTGNSLRLLLAFGRRDSPEVARATRWLVAHQKADGGWHCFRSRRGTLDCWEALNAFALIPDSERTAAVQRSIERGAEFYLSRGLLREGRGSYAPWLRFHYPRHYYYDLLVGLDVLTALGYGGDRRIQPALDQLESRRTTAGLWTLDAHHPDSEDPEYAIRAPFYPFGLEVTGRPSRWITVTALSVLRRARRL